MELTTRMLADGARVCADGKLYIFGGRWENIYAAAVPFKHPTLSVVLIVELSYEEATREHAVEIALHDADGQALGPHATARLMPMGHPPGLPPGSTLTAPLVVDFPNIEFQQYGRLEWVISLNGDLKGRLPLQIMKAHAARAMVLPGLGLGLPPQQPEPPTPPAEG